MRAIDIRAAFLQANELDQEVFVEPPTDIRKEGVIWKLIKLLYGLKEAIINFWLHMKKVFKEVWLKTVTGDEAYYYKYKKDSLEGIVLTHMDYFSMAGNNDFLNELERKVREELNVSKVDKNI